MAVTITPSIGKSGTARAIPVSGNTVALTPTCEVLVLVPAGVLATLSIDLSQLKINNKKIKICTTQTITALTLTGAGASFVGGIATLAVGTFAEFIYDSISNSFIRLG